MLENRSHEAIERNTAHRHSWAQRTQQITLEMQARNEAQIYSSSPLEFVQKNKKKHFCFSSCVEMNPKNYHQRFRSLNHFK